MNSNQCPKLEKCPIFSNNTLHNEMLGKTYKNLYCLSGPDKYHTCKRYVFSEKYGKGAPENILPNSTLDNHEIAKRMGLTVVG